MPKTFLAIYIFWNFHEENLTKFSKLLGMKSHWINNRPGGGCTDNLIEVRAGILGLDRT